MKKISIISSVDNGNLKRNRDLISKAIKSFEGKQITITIERLRKKRSKDQNRYYHGIVIPIIQQGLYDATGEMRDSNSIHYQILLPLFSPKRDITNIETGEIVSESITSSEMTTTEFMEYIMSIQKWAIEFLNVNIPSPNEYLTLNL